VTTTHVRRAAAAPFLVLVLSSLFVVAGTNARPASAAIGIPLPAVLSPASLTALVTDGVGTVSAALSVAAGSGVVVTVGEAATAAAAPVAAAGVAVTAGTALVGLGTGYGIGTGLRLLWKWKTGQNPAYADPVQTGASPGGQFIGCDATCSGDTYTGNGGSVRITQGARVAGSTTNIVALNGGLAGWVNRTNCGGFNTEGPPLGAAGSASPVTCAAGRVPTQISVYFSGSGYTAATYELPSTVPSPPPASNPGTTTVTSTPKTDCQPPGGAAHAVMGQAITYTGNTPSASLPAILPAPCPAGEKAVGFSVPSTGAGGATVPSPIAPWSPTTVPAAFPECLNNACLLELHRVGPDGSRVTCNNTTLCAGWKTLPQLGPARTVKRATDGATITTLPPRDPTGDHYECLWGPYELEAAECSPVPTEKPPGPPEDGDESRGCFSGMGISPLTWPKGLVISPLKCLFIPDLAKVEADNATLQQAWDTSPPRVYLNVVTGLLQPVTGLVGVGQPDCDGPGFTFHFLGPEWTLHPLSACSGIPAAASALILPVEAFFVYVSGLFACVRMLSGTIGLAGPGDA
jgi:hypothetical protein